MEVLRTRVAALVARRVAAEAIDAERALTHATAVLETVVTRCVVTLARAGLLRDADAARVAIRRLGARDRRKI